MRGIALTSLKPALRTPRGTAPDHEKRRYKPFVAAQQHRTAGIAERPARRNRSGKRRNIAHTEIQTLTGQWMNHMRRVSNERNARRDQTARLAYCQRKPAHRREALECAQ